MPYVTIQHHHHPYRMHYLEAGDASKPLVLCVHGLSQNARVFEFVMETLRPHFHVVSVDVLGRGKSDALRNPDDYTIENYTDHICQFLAQLNMLHNTPIRWVGTSMGALIAMNYCARRKQNQEKNPAVWPLSHLVVNDIGPRIDAASLQRISQYVGREYVFQAPQEYADTLAKYQVCWGDLTPEQMLKVCDALLYKRDDGQYGRPYDLKIANNFQVEAERGIDRTDEWMAVECPVLLIRGETSDILTEEHAAWMVASKKTGQVQRLNVPKSSHAPALAEPWLLEKMLQFLSR